MTSTAIISFLFFTILVFFISWYKIRKDKQQTAEDHFLSGRRLGFIMTGGALFLSNISSNQFIGENELVYKNNMSVMAWGLTSVVAMLIVSEFFMPVYHRIGAVTTVDFLEKRYDKATKTLVSVVILISYMVNLLPPVLYGGSVAFNGIFHLSDLLHLDYWKTIWLIAATIGTIGAIYCIRGGLKVIAISDTVLSVGMLIIGIVLPYFGLKYLGKGSIHNGIGIILHSHQEHLNAIGTSRDAIPFSTIFTGMLLINLHYWGTEQFIVQQSLASKSLADSQKGIALTCMGKIISPLFLNIPGLIAVHLYASMPNTAEVFPRLARDILPPLFSGLIAAVVFGAALSTFNAGLNSISTIFIMNLYKPARQARNKPVGEKQLLQTARIFQIIVTLIAITIAPFIAFAKDGFYTYLQKVAGLFSLPVFTILIVGFATRKVPPIAARAGLLFFIFTYSLSQFVFTIHLHFLHLLAILFILTTLFMLLIGKLYPMETPYKKEYNPAVNLEPWKQRYIYGGILIACVVALYILFSPLVLARVF